MARELRKPRSPDGPRHWRRRELKQTPKLQSDRDPNSANAKLLSTSDWLFALALAAAVFLAYQPCWRGGEVWDDDAHITKVELRSWHGLYRIWTDVPATSQYYPLLHSAFWLEHAAWGDWTPAYQMPAYHLTNLALHSLAALLVLAVLRRLNLPGRAPGSGHLRAASGASRIGGLDYGAEEHAFGRLLPQRRAGLPPLRPDAAQRNGTPLPRPCS